MFLGLLMQLNIFYFLRFFSCDSSSICHNVGLSVCGQRVLQMHSGLVSALLLQLLLCLILLVLQIYFQLQMTSISDNVSQSECQFRVLVVSLCVCNEFHRHIMLLFFVLPSSAQSQFKCSSLGLLPSSALSQLKCSLLRLRWTFLSIFHPTNHPGKFQRSKIEHYFHVSRSQKSF